MCSKLEVLPAGIAMQIGYDSLLTLHSRGLIEDCRSSVRAAAVIALSGASGRS